MDEKTEELRNIFMEVAEEDTVTERQEESPGTLTGEQPVDDRLDALIARMREQYEFDTGLDTEQLRSIARGFFTGISDEELAERIDEGPESVFLARLDLHLLRESDRDVSFDFEAFRETIATGESLENLATRFDADEAEVKRARLVVTAEREMRKTNYRFRDEFDELLGDGDLAEHITEEVTDDGLKDATEGVEVNTSF